MNLKRDTTSGALINVDASGYEMAKLRRDARLRRQKEQQTLETTLSSIVSRLDALEKAVKELSKKK